MNYPLISEYIEAIKSAEENFEELSYLRPVLSDDGLPIMTSGNFAVVFKMKDEQSGKFYAVKCFTKEQEGRAEAYREITKELENLLSPYILSIRYLEKELFVDTDQTTETEFPVLLMDWVEGKTLDKYLRENLDDKYALEMLAYRFSQLAQWLIPQPFAHGDLKPDNILVREDGTLVLVDYDGMYVPAMKGQKARELGSPDFRHPQRTEDDFDAHIDDFPLVSILLSLHTISIDPQLLEEYGAADRLLFSREDYLNIDCHPIINQLLVYNDSNINVIISIFITLANHKFCFTVPFFKKPHKEEMLERLWVNDIFLLSKQTTDDLASVQSKSIDILLKGLIDLDDFLTANGIDYMLTGSLGLYMHGLTPNTYLPHDIDIIILDGGIPFLPDDSLLILFEKYCGSSGPIYEDGTRTFIFYIGSHHVEVNAFLHDNALFSPNSYREMLILNHSIKVSDAFCIFKEKNRLRRLKDYQFNIDLQNKLNGYLNQQTNKNEITDSNHGYYTDPRDGYTYKTIKIGNQIWLAENLRYLPRIGNGYYVYDYHGNDVSEAKQTQNYKDFGVLYNMSAAQEACPVGWHIPSDFEWKELEQYIGLSDFSTEKCVLINDVKHYFRGKNQGSNLMANNIETKTGNLIKNKNEDYGFNAFLGGWKFFRGEFGQKHLVAKWWSNSVSHTVYDIHSNSFYIYRVLYYNESGIGYGCCSEECCLSLRCVKDVSLPFPEIPHKEITFIPYPEPKDSVKKKIKSLFLQVVKDPFYSYLAITNSIISEESFIGDKIRPLWVPSEIDKCLKVKIEVKGTNVECTYSQNGVKSSFISKCNSGNIDDVVELTYNLLNRLGLVGYFISDVSKAINSINYNNWLNDREDDLPF